MEAARGGAVAAERVESLQRVAKRDTYDLALDFPFFVSIPYLIALDVAKFETRDHTPI